MKITLKAGALFALATATLLPAAAQAETQSFTHEGVRYTYTTSVKEGRTIVSGRSDDWRPFRLVIKDGLVKGTVNGRPVAFAVASAERVDALAMR